MSITPVPCTDDKQQKPSAERILLLRGIYTYRSIIDATLKSLHNLQSITNSRRSYVRLTTLHDLFPTISRIGQNILIQSTDPFIAPNLQFSYHRRWLNRLHDEVNAFLYEEIELNSRVETLEEDLIEKPEMFFNSDVRKIFWRIINAIQAFDKELKRHASLKRKISFMRQYIKGPPEIYNHVIASRVYMYSLDILEATFTLKKESDQDWDPSPSLHERVKGQISRLENLVKVYFHCIHPNLLFSNLKRHDARRILTITHYATGLHPTKMFSGNTERTATDYHLIIGSLDDPSTLPFKKSKGWIFSPEALCYQHPQIKHSRFFVYPFNLNFFDKNSQIFCSTLTNILTTTVKTTTTFFCEVSKHDSYSLFKAMHENLVEFSKLPLAFTRIQI